VIEITALSETILAESIKVLGPAAKRFLDRQTVHHMGGLAFDDLRAEHIPDLVKWVGISAQLIIDKKKAEELVKKISDLA
jgi:hypothetical protein